MSDLVSVPVDDQALTQIEHALGGVFTVDDDGNHALVGAEFTLHQLLDFWSGYDQADEYFDGYIGNAPVYVHTKPILHEHDLIRALIAEIHRLRDEP